MVVKACLLCINSPLSKDSCATMEALANISFSYAPMASFVVVYFAEVRHLLNVKASNIAMLTLHRQTMALHGRHRQ